MSTEETAGGDESATARGPVYTASENTTSRHPQDWGRAVAVVFERLAEQARVAGNGPETRNLFDADITIHVKKIPDGVTISATWETTFESDEE
jgi:hypothetical protein